jgi:hypothetical protein
MIQQHEDDAIAFNELSTDQDVDEDMKKEVVTALCIM